MRRKGYERRIHVIRVVDNEPSVVESERVLLGAQNLTEVPERPCDCTMWKLEIRFADKPCELAGGGEWALLRV